MNFNKIISVTLALFFASSCFAKATTTYFKTIEEAQQICPMVSSMIFVPFDKSQTSDGNILGIGPAGRKFKSLSNRMPHPQALNADNQVLNVRFIKGKNDSYGYESCAYGMCVVACFYTYPALDGSEPNLTMGQDLSSH